MESVHTLTDNIILYILARMWHKISHHCKQESMDLCMNKAKILMNLNDQNDYNEQKLQFNKF